MGGHWSFDTGSPQGRRQTVPFPGVHVGYQSLQIRTEFLLEHFQSGTLGRRTPCGLAAAADCNADTREKGEERRQTGDQTEHPQANPAPQSFESCGSSTCHDRRRPNVTPGTPAYGTSYEPHLRRGRLHMPSGIQCKVTVARWRNHVGPRRLGCHEIGEGLGAANHAVLDDDVYSGSTLVHPHAFGPPELRSRPQRNIALSGDLCSDGAGISHPKITGIDGYGELQVAGRRPGERLRHTFERLGKHDDGSVFALNLLGHFATEDGGPQRETVRHRCVSHSQLSGGEGKRNLVMHEQVVPASVHHARVSHAEGSGAGISPGTLQFRRRQRRTGSKPGAYVSGKPCHDHQVQLLAQNNRVARRDYLYGHVVCGSRIRSGSDNFGKPFMKLRTAFTTHGSHRYRQFSGIDDVAPNANANRTDYRTARHCSAEAVAPCRLSRPAHPHRREHRRLACSDQVETGNRRNQNFGGHASIGCDADGDDDLVTDLGFRPVHRSSYLRLLDRHR